MIEVKTVSGSIWADGFVQLNERDRLTIKAVYGTQNIKDSIKGDKQMIEAKQMIDFALEHFMNEGRKQKCKRCGGSGKYIYVSVYGENCFDCGGCGEKVKQPTKRELEKMIRDNPDGLGIPTTV